MAIARMIVKMRTPYITTTLMSLVPFERPGLYRELRVGILTTASLILVYDPDWLMSLTDEEAAGALFHETQHPIRRHYTRGEDFADKRRYNIAGDMPINCDARDCGYTLPKGSYFPDYYGFEEGLSAEEYYDMMPEGGGPPQKQKGQGKGAAGQGPPGEGDGQDPGQGGEGPDPNQPACGGACGSAAGNKSPIEDQVEEELEKESPGAAKSPVEVEATMKAQAQEILDHITQKGRGNMPAHLVEWAKFALKPPKVHWRRALPRIIRRATGKAKQGGENYSKKRISKRSFLRGYVIPSLISQKPEIFIIRDTSGSMGKPQLQDVQNESVGALKAVGVESVMFMDADAAANKPRRVTVQDIPKLPITGRGGTDFREAIAIAAKWKPRPQVIMYYTDGDGPAPERPPPGIVFIWVIISGHYNKAPVKWGYHIFVGPDTGVAEEDEF